MGTYTFDVEYDVAVIGGGAAGKSAALMAARAGLNVVILEKMDAAMGSSMHAEGCCAFESSEQKAREGGEVHMPSKEEGFKEYLNYSHFRAYAPVVSMFVENSADAVEMLKGVGVTFDDVVKYLPDMEEELASMHIPEGLGMKVQELLLRAVIQEDVDIYVRTKVNHVLLEEGRAVGVEITDADGCDLLVGAKAVVVATGGYAFNPDMVARFNVLGGDTHVWTTLPDELGVNNTGDGITMVEEIGGLVNGGVLQLFAGGMGKIVGSESGAAGTQPTLWVDQHGKRFINEDVAKRGTYAGTCLAALGGSYGYGILDQSIIDHLRTVGSEISFGAFLPYHQPMSHVMVEMKEDMEQGTVFMADTIEDLADQIGVDKDQFLRTVDAYNAMCAAGKDEEFYKDPQFLDALVTGPFYAFKIAPDFPTSCGGIVVNEKLQVIGADHKPIKGLYAAGNDASGLYGDTYTMTIPGSTNGFAHTSGMVAGRVIAEALSH